MKDGKILIWLTVLFAGLKAAYEVAKESGLFEKKEEITQPETHKED